MAGPGRGALLALPPCFVKRDPDSGKTLPMSEKPPHPSREQRPPSREERLAAKLRENLRRRKVQARDMRESGLPKPEPDS
jgi:hypothetical protein